MKIYFFNELDALGDDFIGRCAAFFPEWRREEMLKFKHLSGQVKNAVAYLLLINALRKQDCFYELPQFEYNEHGKPFLKNYPDWHFNISHSRTAVVCVLSKENIGIDIQEVGAYKESLANYSCNEKELKFINKSENPADEFYRLWTQKEAAFKYYGTGITDDLKNILDNKDTKISSTKIENIWLSVCYKNG